MKRFAATAILFAYVAFGGLGFLLMTGMGHHHVPNCPFMLGEQVLCGMDAFDHASAWKAMFAATIPSLLLAIAVAAAGAIYMLSLEIAASPPKALGPLAGRPETFVARSQYQLAFSRGIIHPKNP